ncbi:MAG: zinc ribbon domain-containing protein [Paracoccaceae bacterium]|nr:zinc ribbon domain-containing protein [Paracoccaceae bacterium]
MPGQHLVRIDRWFAPGKTCSLCGSRVEDMPLSVPRWTYRTCGQEHYRDVNAARNIRQQGILKMKAKRPSVSACGGWRKTGMLSAESGEAGNPVFQGGEQSRHR